MDWIHPKTIIGPPAEGDRYLKRPHITEQIWRAIENGEHILFTAPRRVGKSSVMIDTRDNHKNGYVVIYQNVESDSHPNEFYKRLWSLIVESLYTTTARRKKWGQWIKARTVGEISVEGGVKFESKAIDFKSELLELVKEITKTVDRVVLLLDEFPDVLDNIRKNHGDEEAIELLHVMRQIRHEKELHGLSLVLAGSVGLEHIVSKIDRLKLINDLTRISVGAMSKEESEELIEMILDGASLQMDEEIRGLLIQAISHPIPFHFQLMIRKLDDLACANGTPTVNQEMMKKAFRMLVLENQHFEDWEQRLRGYLSPNDGTYCIHLLTLAAHRSLNIQQAFDITQNRTPDLGYMHLIESVLIRDGYLVRYGNDLKFQSSLLQEWWKHRHPEFELQH